MKRVNGTWQHLGLSMVVLVVSGLLAQIESTSSRFILYAITLVFTVELTQIEMLRKIYWLDTLHDIVIGLIFPIILWFIIK